MSWKIDTPLRIGDHVIAAIAEQKISVDTFGPALIAAARKQPLVVLHLRNGVVSAAGVNGHSNQAAEIELLYPGAIAQVQSLIEDGE